MPLVAVIAIGVGLLCMYKVHQFSEPPPVTTVNGPQAPEEFNVKRLTYKVSGPAGTSGTLVYTDVDGHPHKVDFTLTSLPWSHDETTTLTVVSGSISVHVHGGPVSCQMLVDGVLGNDPAAEQHGDHEDADVVCRVKSA